MLVQSLCLFYPSTHACTQAAECGWRKTQPPSRVSLEMHDAPSQVDPQGCLPVLPHLPGEFICPFSEMTVSHFLLSPQTTNISFLLLSFLLTEKRNMKTTFTHSHREVNPPARPCAHCSGGWVSASLCPGSHPFPVIAKKPTSYTGHDDPGLVLSTLSTN